MYFPLTSVRCRLSECEDGNSSFIQPWLGHAVPFREGSTLPSRCHRYASNNASRLLEYNLDIAENQTYQSCSPEYFNNSEVYRCNEWVYEGECVTILREVRITYLLKCFSAVSIFQNV